MGAGGSFKPELPRPAACPRLPGQARQVPPVPRLQLRAARLHRRFHLVVDVEVEDIGGDVRLQDSQLWQLDVTKLDNLALKDGQLPEAGRLDVQFVEEMILAHFELDQFQDTYPLVLEGLLDDQVGHIHIDWVSCTVVEVPDAMEDQFLEVD